MKRSQVGISIFMVSVITLIFIGCVTYSPFPDKLPDAIPNGFVVFSSVGATDVGPYTYTIEKDRNGKTSLITTGSQLAEGRRRRIEEPPGLHTYRVKLVSTNEEVVVNVIEGMITPVAVIIRRGREVSDASGTSYFFNMNVQVDKPMQFQK